MGWTVVDYQVSARASQPADDTGKATITWPPVPGTQVWRVEAITVDATSTADSVLYVYAEPLAGSPVPASGSRWGNFTTGDGTPVTVTAGNNLALVWEGLTPGTVARARVQYVVMAGTAGAPTPVAA